jgi:hypothetical protein
MFQKQDCIVGILEYRYPSPINQMRNETPYLTLFFCPRNKDGKYISNNVENNRKKKITLSQPFPCLEIMHNVIINLNFNATR